MTEFPGLTAEKIERLHGVARAALDGRLDAARIRSVDADVAMRDLQGIKGIGLFYSALIVIRASGVTDVLPEDEPQMRDLIRRLYGLSAPPDADTLRRITEPWRPWRTWTSVLVRAAGPHLAPP